MFLDTSQYGPVDTLVFLGGFALWTPAYLIIVRRAWRTRWVEIPLLGACADVAWDFLAGVVFAEGLGWGVEWFFAAAFVCDLALVVVIVRWLPVAPTEVAGRVWPFVAPLAIGAVGALIIAFRRDGLDTELGTRSAYLAAFLLGVGYLWRAVTIDDPRRLSVAVGVIKLLADALVSQFVFRHDPHRFGRTLVVLLTAADVGYLVVLGLRHRSQITGATADAMTDATAGVTT